MFSDYNRSDRNLERISIISSKRYSDSLHLNASYNGDFAAFQDRLLHFGLALC
jgi:hypothetical protein